MVDNGARELEGMDRAAARAILRRRAVSITDDGFTVQTVPPRGFITVRLTTGEHVMFFGDKETKKRLRQLYDCCS